MNTDKIADIIYLILAFVLGCLFVSFILVSILMTSCAACQNKHSMCFGAYCAITHSKAFHLFLHVGLSWGGKCVPNSLFAQ